MKKRKNIEKNEIPKRSFIITKNGVYYLIAFVALLIFTQALRNPVSSVIYYSFVIFVPINLVFTLIASKGVRVNLEISESTAEKHTPFSYIITITNESVFPIPFSDAYLRIPDKESVRTSVKKVIISMPPMSESSIKNTVSFPFRGTYSIGIDAIYVYDFFKAFKFRVDINEKKELFVVPRRLKSDIARGIVSSDSSGITSRSPFSPEKTEVDDIRDYRLGDQLKSIHWKLSSKSENFIVREYSQGTVHSNLIFVDFSEKNYEKICAIPEPGTDPNPFELKKSTYLHDMNDYCVDGAVEAAVSIVEKYILDGENCILAWNDSRSSSGIFAFMLSTESDFEKVFKLFAGAPICPNEASLKQLHDAFRTWTDVRKIYVTSALDHDSMLAYSIIAEEDSSTSFGNSDMIYFNSSSRMKDPTLWRSYIEDCAMQLRKKGINLKEFHTNDIRAKEVNHEKQQNL